MTYEWMLKCLELFQLTEWRLSWLTRQDNFLMSQTCCEAMLSMPVPNPMTCSGLSINEVEAIEWITEFGFS